MIAGCPADGTGPNHRGTPVGSGLLATYGVSYRNAAAAFCPPNTFDVSNGYRIVG